MSELPSRDEIRNRPRWYERCDVNPILDAYASGELIDLTAVVDRMRAAQDDWCPNRENTKEMLLAVLGFEV